MDKFFITDQATSLIDIITPYAGCGESLEISSFGANRYHLGVLCNFFSKVTLVSRYHSSMNSKNLSCIEILEREHKGFVYHNRRVHAKIVRINRETVILTSANLAENKSAEFYSISHNVDKDVQGKLDVFFGPLSGNSNEKSPLDINISLDIDINLDIDLEF